MGFCYKTSRWLDRLWKEHLEASPSARRLVADGIKKQGEPFAGFPSDLHSRLYLRDDPELLESAPSWASRLHGLASELGEWHKLRTICARNGFAAGIAAEVLLEQLLPHVPDASPGSPVSPEGAPGANRNSESNSPSLVTGAGSGRQDGSGLSSNPADSDWSEQEKAEASVSDASLRAAIRKASRAARSKVQEAEAQTEGMSTPLGLSQPGTNTIAATGPANLRAVREAHQLLISSSRLRRISKLAGRLERVAASKAKSKVRPGVGEIHGIDLGGDLSRMLPSELVLLRHSRLRLALLARLLQNRALIYGMTGREPQGRGPIVVLLDESSSMRDADNDIWSKAVCLALLATATRQKRAWHLVAFNGRILREVAIAPGKATTGDIQRALDHGCHGGTDFDNPVGRAIDIINSSPTMKQADVVIITDGESDLTTETVNRARSLTQSEGVSWYVIGVGPTADDCVASLGSIATSMVKVQNTDNSELIVPIINLNGSSSAA